VRRLIGEFTRGKPYVGSFAGYRFDNFGQNVDIVRARTSDFYPAAPDARYDAMGLLVLLYGRRVRLNRGIAVDRATIRTPSGGSLTYYRHRPNRDAVAAWALLQ
jgi:hypothetical protein